MEHISPKEMRNIRLSCPQKWREYAKALSLSRSGMNARQVADEMGKRHMWAWSAIKSAEYNSLPKTKKFTDGLSVRAANVLAQEGYTSKSQVRKDVKSGVLSPDARIHNYGKVSHAEVEAWLGIDRAEEKARDMINAAGLDDTDEMLEVCKRIAKSGYRKP